MDKPLHVRVAEALSWTDCQSIGIRGGVEKWVGRRPNGPVWRDAVMFEPIPPYGEDAPEGWAATGPLISRFLITPCQPIEAGGAWSAVYYEPDGEDGQDAPGANPAEALCNLVLALAEAGRLR